MDLYNYLEEHDSLPDILTIRRFSAADARRLRPFLLDLSAYDIVSDYYPYALQYYTDTDGKIQWLPVCGIPETIIADQTLIELVSCGSLFFVKTVISHDLIRRIIFRGDPSDRIKVQIISNVVRTGKSCFCGL